MSEIFLRNVYIRNESSNFFKEEINNGFTRIDPEKPSKYVRNYLSLYNYLKINSEPYYCPELKGFFIYFKDHYEYRPDDWIKVKW